MDGMGEAERSVDRSVLDRVHAGDSEALAVVFEALSDDVYRLAYHLTGSTAEAQDVVQDVFLGLPQALGTYRELGKFERWLKRVTVRTVLMRMRAANLHRDTLLLIALRPRTRGSEEMRLVDRMSIERALARMPDSLRVVFVLKEIEGFSHAEIAEQLGISVAASAIRLHRARRFLRGQLMGRR